MEIDSEKIVLVNIFLTIIIFYFLICVNSLKSYYDFLTQKSYRLLDDENNKKMKIYKKITNNKNNFNIKTIILNSILYGILFLNIFQYKIIFKTLNYVYVLFFVFLMVVIEYISYYFGMYKKEKNINYFVIVVNFLFSIITPIYYILNCTLAVICKVLISNFGDNIDIMTEEEIKHMVEEVSESGLIETSKKEMLSNIFDFKDKKIPEVMTHRTDVVAIDIEDYNKNEIINLALLEGFSRIPVYKDDIDNIIGILYIKDLLKLLIYKNEKTFNIEEFIREPFYIPETNNCGNLFDSLCSKKLQMAVVVDEYGGTSGIVTMEDLLESIVGDIEDEYDEDEFDIKKIDEKTYIVDGGYDLLDFIIEYGLKVNNFENERKANTMSGFIVSYTKKVPKNGDDIKIKIGNAVFNVLEVKDNKIKTIKVIFD